MMKIIIAGMLGMLLVVMCEVGVYSEEDTKKEGMSPAEMEAIREHNQGTEFLLQKKYKEAIVYFKKAIELDQNFTEAHYNLGIAYEELERYKDSIKVLKKAVQLNPTHANAYYALGYDYYRLKEYPEAITAFTQSINIRPDNAFAHSKLGYAYLKVGNKDAAREHYEVLKTLDTTLASELYRELSKDKK